MKFTSFVSVSPQRDAARNAANVQRTTPAIQLVASSKVSPYAHIYVQCRHRGPIEILHRCGSSSPLGHIPQPSGYRQRSQSLVLAPRNAAPKPETYSLCDSQFAWRDAIVWRGEDGSRHRNVLVCEILSRTHKTFVMGTMSLSERRSRRVAWGLFDRFLRLVCVVHLHRWWLHVIVLDVSLTRAGGTRCTPSRLLTESPRLRRVLSYEKILISSLCFLLLE